MQLFVSKKQYCDFVVWSPEMMCVERIMPRTVWWDEKSRQGMRFHAECVMPELCTRFFTKQSAIALTVSRVHSGFFGLVVHRTSRFEES